MILMNFFKVVCVFNREIGCLGSGFIIRWHLVSLPSIDGFIVLPVVFLFTCTSSSSLELLVSLSLRAERVFVFRLGLDASLAPVLDSDPDLDLSVPLIVEKSVSWT